jgi:hypothetical protein
MFTTEGHRKTRKIVFFSVFRVLPWLMTGAMIDAGLAFGEKSP